MKKILLITLLAAILAFALQVQPARAADVDNKAVKVFETLNTIVFYNTTSFSAADATDDLNTMAFYIGDRDRTQPIMFEIYGSATTNFDVNVFVHGTLFAPTSGDSIDTAAFLVGTTNTADLDDIGSATVVIDTLEVVSNVTDDHIDNAEWIYLQFDGQTGNPAAQTMTWAITIIKKEQGNLARFRSGNSVLVRPICTVCP